MKKIYCLLCFVLILFLTGCSTNSIDDRLIGEWKNEQSTYIFKGNGELEVYVSGVYEALEGEQINATFDYCAQNGVYEIDHGDRGSEFYNYEITYGATADGQIVEMLAIWQESYEGTSLKTYYTKVG